MSNHKIRLAFESCVEYNGKLWFCAFDHNGLYYIDKESDHSDAVLAGVIPDEELYAYRLFSSIKAVNNKIVLIPFFAKEIAIYDIGSGSFIKIPLKDASLFSNHPSALNTRKFWCSVVYKNYVYLFPHNYPASVRIDTDTLDVSYSSEAAEIIDKNRINGECYLTDVYVENEWAFFSCGCANIWLKMSLENGRWESADIQYNGTGYNGIYKSDEKIWLAPRIKGAILCIDWKIGKISAYENYPEGFWAPAVPFHTIYSFYDQLLFVPALANCFVLLDTNTGEMKNMLQASAFLSDRKKDCFSYDLVMYNDVHDNKLCFVSGVDCKLYTISSDHPLKSQEISIISDYPCTEKLITGVFNVSDHKTVGESRSLNLYALFKTIYLESECNISNKNTNVIGDAIHESIKAKL